MNSKSIFKAAATGALAVFAAQALHSVTGKKTGAVGIAIKVAGATGGALLGFKLAR